MRRRTFLTHSMIAAAGLPVFARGWHRAATTELSLPRPECSMWIYLWDLVDEGYAAVLDRLKENGLASVSLAAAYHAGKFLSPHNPRRKVVIPEDGTVYFAPTPSRYGRIKPIVNTFVGKGDHLRRVRREAEKRGLGTRAWVVCCHNTPLGTRYRDIATQTAFGDRLPHNLCPSNPDVRHYLRALVRDIAAEGVDTIELEALQFQGYAHGMHHEREGIPLSLVARFLLGICFCPHCIQRARMEHVAMEEIRNYTRERLGEVFGGQSVTSSLPASLDGLPADLFTPFFSWRESVVVSLIRELRESVGPSGPAVRPLVGPDPVARKIVSMNPVEGGKAAGGLILLAYVKEGSEIRPELERLQSSLPGCDLRVGMHLGMPETGGKREFLSRMETCLAAGITRFNYYNYGFIPLAHLGWIRESAGRP